jgi:predicted metal-dependent peptidase
MKASDIENATGPLPHAMRITMARFMTKYPSYAVIMMRLCKVSMSESIPTAATDGHSLWFNPTFFEGLTQPEREFILGHELMHVVMQHMARAKGYEQVTFGPDGKLFNPKKWNYAADYIINKMLHDSGVGKMPMGGLFDPNISWETQGASEVYCMIPDPPDDDDAGGSTPTDQHVAPDNSTQTPTPQQTQRALAQAASVEKKAGSGSDIFGKLLGDISSPKKDWRELLRSAVTNLMGHDEFSFERVNRRALVMNKMILPDAVGHTSNAVAIGFDISCSVSEAETNAFLSEMSGIMQDANPAGCKVFFINTKVVGVETVEDYSELPSLHIPQGGGTDLEVAYPSMAEEMLEFESDYSIIMLTDGETHTSEASNPGVPVIWVTTCATDLAYGDVIKLEL